MNEAIYSVPNWLLGVLTVGGSVAATLAGYRVFKRFFPNRFPENRIATAAQLAGIMATINSLLLAFTAVSVWDAYRAADGAVGDEASAVGQMSRDMNTYGPAMRPTHKKLEEYVLCAIEDEWPTLAEGRANTKCWIAMDLVFRELGKIEPKTERDKIILGEIWARVNDIVRFRRARVFSSQSGVPGTLWTVVLIGSALTFLFCFTLDPDLFGHMILAGLSATTGLVFFFILAMDHPFAGKESVDPAPFKTFLVNAERRERATAEYEAEQAALKAAKKK